MGMARVSVLGSVFRGIKGVVEILAANIQPFCDQSKLSGCEEIPV
jgi:hypothetical protein